MGKPKKANLKNQNKNPPFEQQILDSKIAKQKNRPKIRLRTENDDQFVSSKISQKILHTARKQQLEQNETVEVKKFGGLSKLNLGSVETGEDEHVTEQDFFDDIPMNEEDEKAFRMFQNPEGIKTKNLSDVIMEKIAVKQTDLQSKFSDNGSLAIEDVDPRVQEMYKGVGEVMKRYRSGKVPKAFKVIPNLTNWEQILFLTEPHNWSAAAMFQATRTFCSVLSQDMTQRFYNLVLLPRVRDDLCEYKRLNMHLYNALKKALFKPAAFFKGVILPLLESGDCNLREAIIFGSVVARNTIPVLPSSACLLKICEMEYSGANVIFIRILLDKRYALPYRVIDSSVSYFLKFVRDSRQMPVLWHQCLLTFVQRYKHDISSEQKVSLFGLLRKQNHPSITQEIRRELQAAKCRDAEVQNCEQKHEDDFNMKEDEGMDDMETYD